MLQCALSSMLENMRHPHHDHTRLARLRHMVRPHPHEAADKVDAAMEASAEGPRTLWLSLAALAVTPCPACPPRWCTPIPSPGRAPATTRCWRHISSQERPSPRWLPRWRGRCLP
jgi:hypothetical protein